MTAEELALALREAHPDAQPLELDAEVAESWLAEAGGDATDTDLLAAALVAWEALIAS